MSMKSRDGEGGSRFAEALAKAMRKIGKNGLLSLGDKYRIYILFVLVFCFMSLFAPRFFAPGVCTVYS